MRNVHIACIVHDVQYTVYTLFVLSTNCGTEVTHGTQCNVLIVYSCAVSCVYTVLSACIAYIANIANAVHNVYICTTYNKQLYVYVYITNMYLCIEYII